MPTSSSYAMTTVDLFELVWHYLMSTLKTHGFDEELMILRPQSVADSDYELDWSYTVRCTKEWSDDELLSHLCSKAFTIPPRDYSPSDPFVYVRTEDGVITALPHGYRIPLMFVAKYQWETIFRTLSLQNRHHWEAGRDEIFHLTRLCHALFSKARAKAESDGGMEKGWRCVMFDRVLTRFYKGWPVCSPAKLEAFISHFSSKEYERDVLKNDWKRWALKGFFRPPSSSPSIHLSEEDVSNGISGVDLIKRLSKVDNVWTLSTATKNNNLKRRPIKFMQPTEDSSSELTDFDLSPDEDEDDEITNLDLHSPSLAETPTKRCRKPSEDDDTKNRSGKRAKLEDIVRSISSPPCSPIVSPPPLGSGDEFDEEHDSLPKFKVPRQILHSYGWKLLSETDGLVRRRQREEQREEEDEAAADVLPTCGDDDPSISTPPSSELSSLLPAKYPFDAYPSSKANPSSSSSIRHDTPCQALLRSVLQPNELPTSPNLTSISSKSKGKQPESASTNSITTATSTTTADGPFLRLVRNSAYVSLPSYSRTMKPRTRPPAPAPATIPPSSPKRLSPPMTRGRGGGEGKGADPSGVPSPLSSEFPFSFPVAGKERGGGRQRTPVKNCCSKSTPDVGRDWLNPTGAGADGDSNVNRKKEKAKTKQNVEEKKISSFQHSEPSSSSSMITTSTNIEANGEYDEQGATSTAIPVPPGFERIDCQPEPICSTSYPISSASSSSLSPLSSSVTPSPSGPLVSNGGGVGVTNGDADVEYAPQQVKDRIRELKMRFMTFRDDLERVIGRLEVLEGELDRDMGQVSQTEDKQKDKEFDRDIEMIGVSGSGDAIPGYVDASVGVDVNTMVALRDISVQTASASSAIASHSTDDLSNVPKKNIGKMKPTSSLLSKTDESIPPTQFVNTTGNLSTVVDNLVSIKMLSMMQTLVKSSVGGNSNGKAKLVEPSTANANAATNITKTTTTESDNDLTCQPSPSSSSLSISTASHSMEACDGIMSGLLEELKTIKQEARYRERSEKEDLLAMRQLHSAEVDALRRRLSYLESRNLSLGRWDLNNGGGASGRWKNSRVDDSLELDRHHHRISDDSGFNHSFRRQQYGDRSQAFQQNGLTHYSSRSTSAVNLESASTSTNTTTTPHPLRKPNSLPLPALSITSSTATADSTISSSTPSLPTPTPPTPSDKHYSSGFSKDHHSMGMGMDLSDDSMVNLPLSLPLPIKSQRKKHHIMALAHANFS